MVTSMIVIAICLGVIGVLLIDRIDKNTVSSSQVVSKESTSTTIQNTSSSVVEVMTENPFDRQNSDLTDDEILKYIHGMSHQKVIAKEKWIHYEMTSERIQFLISVVKSGSYENGELYLDILNRWAEGDFSRADKDHNAIWNVQGGTIGEATGVMSPEEEQQYLETKEGSIK